MLLKLQFNCLFSLTSGFPLFIPAIGKEILLKAILTNENCVKSQQHTCDKYK